MAFPSVHDRVTKNPVLRVETRFGFFHRAIIITPADTVANLRPLLSPLQYTLVLMRVAIGGLVRAEIPIPEN
ncbi:MAG: hypothetical protein WA639_10860 [Candidatus Acidiferrum sp.]